jgi:hypothetical protein
MNKIGITYLITVLLVLTSCKKNETPAEILQMTINAIDTIETIYYKQDMIRTNPRNINETIVRYREIYFKRLIEDSIVGVKGHWYFYNDDKNKVLYEDIYDGSKLIRKNNRDSTAAVFDLIKYPGFKETHFWGHNTLYSMQFMFKYILENSEYYQIERLNDTILQDINCIQIRIRLENRESALPGFAYELEDYEGVISTTLLYINKLTYYPIRMKSENYSIENPGEIFFLDQTYSDLKFNINMDEKVLFNTSDDSLFGFKINERKP